MDKVKSASGNFPDNMVPDKILMFYQFLDDNKSSLDFLSYETITDCKKYLEPLLNDNFLSEIYTFYVDDSHSCYSIWNRDKSVDTSSQPVIYNNTEGVYAVCARNLDEFFYLMSFNIIPDLASSLSTYEMLLRLNLSIKSPAEIYTEDKLIEIAAGNQKYNDYQLFLSFIKNTLKINITKNPADVFMDGVKENPNLKEYIRSVDGFNIDPDY